MGLDAIVYRNRQNLHLGHDAKVAKSFAGTGEVYFEDDTIARKHRDQLKANEIRLGNVTEIAQLRDEMNRLSVSASILRNKILYSGSHSGDFIPVDELPAVLDEIRLVRSAGRISRELRIFLDRIEDLVQTGVNENNPIVFI